MKIADCKKCYHHLDHTLNDYRGLVLCNYVNARLERRMVGRSDMDGEFHVSCPLDSNKK